MVQPVRQSSLANQMKAITAVALIGLLPVYQIPAKAQEKKNQPALQQQSVQRDQAYVRQLLKRGTPDAKVESLLQLTSQFASFKRSDEFHAYAVGIIAKEKTALKRLSQSQQTVTSQTPPAAAVADNSSAVVSRRVAAPSNPVGISSVKDSQVRSADNAPDSSEPITANINQAPDPTSTTAVFGGGGFFPAVPAPSNGNGAIQTSSTGTSSAAPAAPNHGGSSANESQSSNTFNSDQGPDPGRSVLVLGATCFPHRRRSVPQFH